MIWLGILVVATLLAVGAVARAAPRPPARYAGGWADGPPGQSRVSPGAFLLPGMGPVRRPRSEDR